MSWILIYMLSIVLFFAVIITGALFQKHLLKIKDNFSKIQIDSACEFKTKEWLQKQGLTDVNVAIINKHSNCYNPKYKVIKLTETTKDSTNLFDSIKCLRLVGYATQHKNKNFMYYFKIATNFITNFISSAFLPILLVCALLKGSAQLNTIAYYLTLVNLICFAAATLLKLFNIIFEAKTTKLALSIIKNDNFIDEKNAKIILSAFNTYNFSVYSQNLLFIFKIAILPTWLDIN